MGDRKNIPVVDLEGEFWKDIPGFKRLYAVSNKQRVKSKKRRGIREKILRPGFHPYGYLKFTFCKNKKLCYKQLHRIMAETFIPNPLKLPCINHIDNNPKNNSIENLEWCTWAHNSRQAYRQERITKVGERNHMSKLTEVQVLEIFNSTETRRQVLADRYNVSYQAIGDIKTGRRWYMLTGKRHPSVKKRICRT